MILRFRAPNGMHRLECEKNWTFGAVLEQLIVKLGAHVDETSLAIGEKPSSLKPAATLATSTVEQLGLKHGDMLYVNYGTREDHNVENAENPDRDQSSVKLNAGVGFSAPLKVKELAIDQELESQDGLIPRAKSSLCRHGDKGMCEYCAPLPPWDREYHEERNLKHISFHAYLKQLNEQTNKKSSASSYIAPLSQPDFRINKNCPTGHKPWPQGICSKCQPSAITLQQQPFRMVDYVEFQRSEMINEFINSWRTTGTQRFGYLYGHYDRYESTPLGISAVVDAIYEPPQHDESDGLSMDVSMVAEEMHKIDVVASDMGLVRLGMIFTDLTDAGAGDGSVFCKRHKDSFFLSSLEVIMAAKHQLKFPNACKYSEQGKFSSKFVTCVISGNVDGEIDISTYQVSAGAEALVQADFVEGSTHPSMAYIQETNADRYVPEIFYMRKNEYNLAVKENAKPAFPVEYLLVSLTHGFPKPDSSRKLTFNSSQFPWANRHAMGVSQDYLQLKSLLLTPATQGDFVALQNLLSDFHLLIYVHSLQILNSEEWKMLLQGTVLGKQDSLYRLVSTPGWQTFVMILQESS
ncbi:LAMI_0E08262g1_1 [Lachancea mirantina]|uniref:Nuclear protein localization protein 4 n=1 Tax=Lachancea mirantina TaxID=1230905 RepID=A0A1G4JN29_9SACH|nr:LAMI_0E08262g1_1 [Lachancea mirantina]